MTTPRVPIPYISDPSLNLTDGWQKERRKLAIKRLKYLKWITMPINVFPLIPDFGLALRPLRPDVNWYWTLAGGEVFVSAPLCWIGFRANVWPDQPLTI